MSKKDLTLPFKLKEKFKEINYETVIKYVLVAVIVALIAVVVIKYFLKDNITPFVSNYDGQNYKVRKVGSPQVKLTAANYLAKINENINKLVNYMHNNNLPDPDTAKRLYTRWSTIELKETNSHEKTAAYTLNKNIEIRLCIRDTNGNFEDINTSMFVILHELAHVMSIGYGHEEEFQNNFAIITHIASSLGLYRPENFQLSPKTYCGVEIHSTPCSMGTCEFNTVKLNH